VAIDYWKLTKDFAPGDSVQRIGPSGGSLSPFVGRVTAAHPGLGVVDVQWPYGNERIFPDELIKINPDLMRYLPPTLDQSYASYDIAKARMASQTTDLWRFRELPPTLFRELAKKWASGTNEVVAYDDLYRAHPGINEGVLRGEVSKFYRVAAGLAELRIQAHAGKTAAYWMAQNRTYRATGDDLVTKKPRCPKCGTGMRRTTYKMHKGEKHRLFACPKDLFLLKQTDILGPDGLPVEW
jgi:ribosomal protein S27AE